MTTVTKLRVARCQRGFRTGLSFAEKAGIEWPRYLAVESKSKYRRFSPEETMRVAALLGVEVDSLFDEKGQARELPSVV